MEEVPSTIPCNQKKKEATKKKKKKKKKKEKQGIRIKKKYLEHERGELKCMTINKPQRRSNINRQRTRVMGNSTGRGFPQNIGK